MKYTLEQILIKSKTKRISFINFSNVVNIYAISIYLGDFVRII